MFRIGSYESGQGRGIGFYIRFNTKAGYLSKSGVLSSDPGFTPMLEYIWESPVFWRTEQEAQEFLNNWIISHPQEYSELVAERLVK